MKRLLGILAVGFLLFPAMAQAQATPDASPVAESRPAGIPAATTMVTVHRVVDGDKVYVRMPNDDLDQILLAGVDSPEPGECFADESKAWLSTLLPKGTTIYLEQSGTADRVGHVVIRYVWLPGVDGKKAALVNTKIVREGYAAFDATYDAPKYFARIEKYDHDAEKKGTGLWGACGGVHEAIPTPTPIPTMTPVPTMTPMPTPTETPKVSSDEQAYIDWLMSQTAMMSASLDAFQDLTSNFVLTDLLDQNWIIRMAAVAVTWQLAYDNAAAQTAPPALAGVHADWTNAMAHYANAADYLVYGIDNLDAASLESAATELDLASESVVSATDGLNQFKRDRGVD